MSHSTYAAADGRVNEIISILDGLAQFSFCDIRDMNVKSLLIRIEFFRNHLYL